MVIVPSCMVDKKDPIIPLSTLEATRPHRAEHAGGAQAMTEQPGLHCDPRSLGTTAPHSGRRRQRATSSASTTSSARMWSAIDEPTTTRLKTSRTAAQYTLPSAVRCSVMSVTTAGRVHLRRTVAAPELLVYGRRRAGAAMLAPVADPGQAGEVHQPGFHSTRRRHSRHGNFSPTSYEDIHLKENEVSA